MENIPKFKNYIGLFVGSLLISGCASSPTNKLADKGNSMMPSAEDPSAINTAQVAEEGIKYLQLNDYDKARRLFSAAIKFNAANGNLHLLLGMSYHQEFIKTGTQEAREKSAVGYQIAARYEPKNPLPLLQLARLEMDAHDYKNATQFFAKAITVSPGNGDAFYGLASSSYLSGDLVTALWSADELTKLHWNPPAVNRLKTVLYNAAGLPEQAEQARAAYISSNQLQGNELTQFDQRLEEIRAVIAGQKWLTPPPELAAQGEPATSAAPPTSPAVTPLADESSSSDLTGTAQKAWYDCAAAAAAPLKSTTQQQSAGAGAFGGIPGMGVNGMGFNSMPSYNSGSSVPSNVGVISTSGAGEEISQLQALPPPCVGAEPPRMAVIDAVILRTEVSDSRSFGVNLLQGINLFFNKSAVRTSPGSTVTTVNYGLGGASISTALAYSLNIANATNNRNEVIARPSLLAIDRLPSTFFSGTTASIAVQSGPGGVSSLTDKQYGISFSVTPTFIDNKSVLLSIKAVRSFVEAPDLGTSGVALSLSRNSVTANVIATFGDTIILSGLTERELTRSDNGVPVLRDIPLAQYLFQNYRTTDFFRTVVVMITLRKPVTDLEKADNASRDKLANAKGGNSRKEYAFYWRIEEYQKFLNSYAPNLDTAIDTLESNELYKNFKSKDLIDTTWGAQPPLNQILNDLKTSIYHGR
ncbi:hypothetical protein [Duganella qianjiadongensis]|uniref:Type II/III secretion system secretin-like domain-containing protein n=1 Tax=Duganella qianjiadongensis TaxID=2692176 RepID=A0ABW9VQZ1_9BURK|nr:hypothetical protein [Duganella qianjiadongensis]MYM42012.1 hypothetical protein [Duganella qianjiadongensis]